MDFPLNIGNMNSIMFTQPILVQPSQKAIVDEFLSWLKDRYLQYVSDVLKPKKPIISLTHIEDLLLSRKISGISLISAALSLNSFYSNLTPSIFIKWGVTDADKSLRKITEMVKNKWNYLYFGLYRQYEWIDRLLDVANGISPETMEHKARGIRISIPPLIRREVWGCKTITSTCHVCNEPIQYDDFECGHIQALARGGETCVSNLAPICRPCNRNMGVMNMKDYKQRFVKMRGIPQIPISSEKVNKSTIPNMSAEAPAPIKDESIPRTFKDIFNEVYPIIAKKWLFAHTNGFEKDKVNEVKHLSEIEGVFRTKMISEITAECQTAYRSYLLCFYYKEAYDSGSENTDCKSRPTEEHVDTELLSSDRFFETAFPFFFDSWMKIISTNDTKKLMENIIRLETDITFCEKITALAMTSCHKCYDTYICAGGNPKNINKQAS